MTGVLQRLENSGVIPVVVIEDIKDALPTAKALLAGGIDVMEITLRTAAALDTIRLVTQQCPDMLAGAGTVLNVTQCKDAIQHGAKFIVSPGLDKEVVSYCKDHNIPVIPGCVTPTEITAAAALGLKILKFFPAKVYGGLSAIKSLSEPFYGIKFIPTGGVNESNLEGFLKAPYIFAVGGSWLCSKTDIAIGNFQEITRLCKEARKTVLELQEDTCRNL